MILDFDTNPSLKSPIFMLKFLIIWSAPIRSDDFHVISMTFIPYERKLGLARLVSLIFFHLAKLFFWETVLLKTDILTKVHMITIELGFD